MQHVLVALAAFASSLVPNLPQHVDVRLIVESTSPRAGQTQFVGLQMTPQPGWHGYWSNPGDAGLAPTVAWTAPAGVHFGPLQHPAPTLLKVQGLTSFVHAGPHVLISRMTVSRDLQPGTALPITAEVTWAACSDKLCVPERATLTIQMKVGSGALSADAVRLHRAVAAEPKAMSPGSFQKEHGNLVLQFPDRADLDARQVRFFPDVNGFFDAADARVISASPLRIEAPAKGSIPTRITGVVSDGSAAFRLNFEPGELTTPQPQPTRRPPVARDVNGRRPAHEQTAARSGQSFRKQHRTSSPWVRQAAVLAALGLGSMTMLIAGRRRKRGA